MERMMFRRLILIVSLGLAGVSLAAAEAPDVTAVLTSSETEVGRPVQLQIKVLETDYQNAHLHANPWH